MPFKRDPGSVAITKTFQNFENQKHEETPGIEKIGTEENSHKI